MDHRQDVHYFEKRAEQELNIASMATDDSIKSLHLNMAARYAALRENAATLEENPV